jgi:Tol biopolymer transport system component
MPFETGLLTFDPRDLRFAMLSPKGIRMKRIYFPDERLAKWQVAQRKETGKWLATQGAILWMTQGGLAIRQMEDDKSGLESFALSPDGQSIAWATKSLKVYTSKAGEKPVFVGFGRDPAWHPEKHLLVFSGARMVGNTPVSFDLRLSDGRGSGKFLTVTQFSDERWPQWYPDGNKILYTMANTTDMFVMDFVP